MSLRWTAICFYGGLIGLLLTVSAWLMLWLWPIERFDWYGGLIGGVFLLAGLVAGIRLVARSGDAHKGGLDRDDNQAGPAGVAADPAEMAEALTGREREMLASLAAGCSNAEIAERHFVSINTVKTHLRQVYAKLGVGRRVQAVARARDLGLLERKITRTGDAAGQPGRQDQRIVIIQRD